MGTETSSDSADDSTASPGTFDTTAVNVEALLARDALLAGRVVTAEDTTDTIAVMLRVAPLPGIFLHVNDQAARQETVSALNGPGVHACDSTDPTQAVKTFTAQRPALVLTDDIELVRNLRAVSGEGQLYVLMLTASGQHALAEGLRAGADDCINSDAAPEMLRAKVKIAQRVVQLECCLRSALKAHRKLATTDELTRVANRHFFSQHFPLEAERAARYAHALSVVMCDIDQFKRINDDFGHSAGDTVLREFSTRLHGCLRRGTDWVARVGGEEFAIVLPETALTAATQVAEKLRECVRASPFQLGEHQLTVTASFGVCGIAQVPARHADISDRLQATADAALYRSKRAGRDRVSAAALDLSRAPS